MSSADTKGRCETCSWWDTSAQSPNAEPDTTGLCRQRPPRADKRLGTAVWPFTSDTDWCGEYKREPQPDDPPY